MGRLLSDYIALAAISDIVWENDADDFALFGTNHQEKPFQGDIAQFTQYLEDRCGFPVTEALAKEALRSLAECGLARITDDNFSGTYLKVSKDRFTDFVERAASEYSKASEEDDGLAFVMRPSDYPTAAAYSKHPLFEDYHELGDDWLKRALLGIRVQYEERGDLPGVSVDPEPEEAPASDRTVTFSDNQISDIENSTNKIIYEVESLNNISGQPGLREIIIGQLKAGRELVRAGTFKVYLIQVTLIEALQFLMKRYERETIGALAAALLSILLKEIGIDN